MFRDTLLIKNNRDFATPFDVYGYSNDTFHRSGALFSGVHLSTVRVLTDFTGLFSTIILRAFKRFRFCRINTRWTDRKRVGAGIRTRSAVEGRKNDNGRRLRPEQKQTTECGEPDNRAKRFVFFHTIEECEFYLIPNPSTAKTTRYGDTFRTWNDDRIL